MRELEVDFEEIAEAMEIREYPQREFLDLETGEVVFIPEELGDLDADEGPDPAILPDWEREYAPVADAIRQGDPRYEIIEHVDSGELYRLMCDFADTVTDQRLAGKLVVALDGRGAFRRFRNVLDDDPAEEQRWYAFKQAWFEERIREWLEPLGITPVARKQRPGG